MWANTTRKRIQGPNSKAGYVKKEKHIRVWETFELTQINTHRFLTTAKLVHDMKIKCLKNKLTHCHFESRLQTINLDCGLWCKHLSVHLSIYTDTFFVSWLTSRWHCTRPLVDSVNTWLLYSWLITSELMVFYFCHHKNVVHCVTEIHR